MVLLVNDIRFCVMKENFLVLYFIFVSFLYITQYKDKNIKNERNVIRIQFELQMKMEGKKK